MSAPRDYGQVAAIGGSALACGRYVVRPYGVSCQRVPVSCQPSGVEAVTQGAYAGVRYLVGHGVLLCRGPEIVVDDVDGHPFSSIAAAAAVVVYDIASQVHALVGLCEGARAQARCARPVARQEVVVIAGSAAAPVASVSVLSLVVSAAVEAVRADAPLHGAVPHAVDRDALVDAPAHRAVVNHDACLLASAETVTLVMCHLPVAEPEPHEPDYGVVRLDEERVIGYAHPVARRRLPGYGDIRILEPKLRFEEYCTGDIEDYGAWPLLHAGMSERARQGVIVKACDVVDLTAASAGDIHSESLRARESREPLSVLCHSGCDVRTHEEAEDKGNYTVFHDM